MKKIPGAGKKRTGSATLVMVIGHSGHNHRVGLTLSVYFGHREHGGHGLYGGHVPGGGRRCVVVAIFVSTPFLIRVRILYTDPDLSTGT